METLIHSDNLYSLSQQKAIILTPVLSGTLSFLGSSIVLYIILKDWKRKLKHVYHRLLLGYSIIDCTSSINFALSALIVPKGSPGVWGAQGSFATCEASGFVTQFAQSQGLYLAAMCSYYLLVLKYNMREDEIARRYERPLHIFAFVSPLVMGILMLHLGMYNPNNINIGWCFINCYPGNCLRVDGVPCERGENYFYWNLVVNIPFFFYLFIVVYTSIYTYQTVRKVERRQSQWGFVGESDMNMASSTMTLGQQQQQQRRLPNSSSSSTTLRGVLPDSTQQTANRIQSFAMTSMESVSRRISFYHNGNNNNVDGNNDDFETSGRIPTTIQRGLSRRLSWQSNRDPNQGENTRQALIQASLYILSFFLTYFWYGSTTFSTLKLDGVEKNRTFYFTFALLNKLFLPAQGVWNIFIYTRPRYVVLSRRFPNASQWELFHRIINPHAVHNPIASQHLPSTNNSNALTDREQKHNSDSFTPELRQGDSPLSVCTQQDTQRDGYNGFPAMDENDSNKSCVLDDSNGESRQDGHCSANCSDGSCDQSCNREIISSSDSGILNVDDYDGMSKTNSKVTNE